VIAELYTNGLDHGVLGLDSKLKNDIEGFGEYLLKRDENLSQLSKDDRIGVSLRLNGANQIEFEVEDSGAGFEHQSVEPSDGSSGRGLGLVEKLSTRIERNDKGNKVKVVLNEREGV
jgi:two-component sensor histidine kinase